MGIPADSRLETLIRGLDARARGSRLAALRALAGAGMGRPARPRGGLTNSHIHTIYSFSPYSPAKAAYLAWANGLSVAGIMDHDSVAGAAEFIEAGRALGIATTAGVELRCSFGRTPFAGRRLNSTDQLSVAYVALHGIPRRGLQAVEDFAAPCRARRMRRSREMALRANAVFADGGAELGLDFDRDVAGISQADDGGTVTERHILFAVARKLIARHGAGRPLLSYLRGAFGAAIPDGLEELLEGGGGDGGGACSGDGGGDGGGGAGIGDGGGGDYEYRLMGLLKGHFLGALYVDATDELADVPEFVALAERAGGIPAYAYLGDVAGSATGDKRDMACEDGYLDGLVAWLAQAGFKAVTFMPARNTPAQLSRLMALCRTHGLLQISGEDTNMPFQPLACPELAEPRYRHLAESAWALVGHGIDAERRIGGGMFSEASVAECPSLDGRVARYAAIGRAEWASGGATGGL